MSSGAPSKTTNGGKKGDARKRGEADAYYLDNSAPTYPPSNGASGTNPIPSYMSNIGKPYAAPPVASGGFGMPSTTGAGTYGSPSPQVHSSMPVAYNPDPVSTYIDESEQNADYNAVSPVLAPTNGGYSHPVLIHQHQDTPPPLDHLIYSDNPEYHSHLEVHHSYHENPLVQKPTLPLRESIKNLFKAYKRYERDQIAHFEQYSVASGLCKKCFPKNWDLAKGPRPHNYRPPRRKIYYVGKYRKVRFLTLRRMKSGGLHFHWWDDTSESSVSNTDSSPTDSGSGSERTRRFRRQDIHEQRMLAKMKKNMAREHKREMKYLQRQQEARQNGIFGTTGAAATTMWRKARESWVHSGYSSDDGLAVGDHDVHGASVHSDARISSAVSSSGGMFVAESSKAESKNASAGKKNVYYDPGFNKDGFNPHYYKPTASSSGGGVVQDVMFAESREPQGLHISHRVTKKRSHRKRLSDASSNSGDSGLAYGYQLSPSTSPSNSDSQPKSSGFWLFGGRKKVKKRRSTSGAYSSSSFDEALAFGAYSSSSASPASALDFQKKNRSQQTWDTVSLDSITHSISSSIRTTRDSIEKSFSYGGGDGRARHEGRSGSGYGAGSRNQRPPGLFVHRRQSRDSWKSESENGGSIYGGVRLGTSISAPSHARQRSDGHRQGHYQNQRPASVQSTGSHSSAGGLVYGAASLRSQSSRQSSPGGRSPSSAGANYDSDEHSSVKSKGGFWGIFGGSGDKKMNKHKAKSHKGKGPTNQVWVDLSEDERETHDTQSGGRYPGGKAGPGSPALVKVYPKPLPDDPRRFDVEYATSTESSQRSPSHQSRGSGSRHHSSHLQKQPRQQDGVTPSQRRALPPPSVAAGAPTPSPVYPSTSAPPPLTPILDSNYRASYNVTSVPPLPPPPPQSVTGSIAGGASNSNYPGSVSEHFSSPGSTITDATTFTSMTARPPLYNIQVDPRDRNLSAGSDLRQQFQKMREAQADQAKAQAVQDQAKVFRSEPMVINNPAITGGEKFNQFFQAPEVDTLRAGGVFVADNSNSKLTHRTQLPQEGYVKQEKARRNMEAQLQFARQWEEEQQERERVRKEEEVRARANAAAEKALQDRMVADYEARVAAHQETLRIQQHDERRRKWEEEQGAKKIHEEAEARRVEEAHQAEIRRQEELRRLEENKRLEEAHKKAMKARAEAEAARIKEEERLAEARRLEMEFAAEQLRIAEMERRKAEEERRREMEEERRRVMEWERQEREEATRREVARLEAARQAEAERLAREEAVRQEAIRQEAAKRAEAERVKREEAVRIAAVAAAAEKERARREYEEQLERERIAEQERLERGRVG